jgi:hypothetical protein
LALRMGIQEGSSDALYRSAAGKLYGDAAPPTPWSLTP